MSAAKNSIPEEYRPLSAWAYFGYNLLYAIPLIGWVFMVIFALDGSNINRRNFTRSYFIIFLIWAILFVLSLVTGITASVFEAIW